MKHIHIKKTIVFITGLLFLVSCSDEFLKTPEAELKVFIKDDAGNLIVPDIIVADETELYFANAGVSFFSVVYPGDKTEKEKIVDKDGNTLTVWKVNHDYNDIDNESYIDSLGKRAVKGIPLAYQDNFNMFLSQLPYIYSNPGQYKVYLEARNTNEEGEVAIGIDAMDLTVIERD
jgi:hypothetical protein